MTSPFPRAFRRSAAVLLAVALVWLATARQGGAQTTLTWDANTGTTGAQDGAGTWNNQGNSNWWNGTTNVQWNNADVSDVAVFGSNTPSIPSYAITVSGTINAGGLTFDAISGSAASAYSFSGTGSSIVLTSGAVIDVMDNASSTGGRITFNTPLTANNLTIRNSDAGNVGFALVNLSGANTLTGTLTLQGNTNASGGIFVSALAATALAGLTSIDVLTNTTLSLAGPTGTNYGQAFTLAGNGAEARGAIRIDNGTNSNPNVISGPITLASSGAAIYANTSIVGNVTGNIGDNGSGFALDVGSASTATAVIILSGNNTFTGGLRVDGGEARVNSAGALNSTTPNVVTFTNNTVNKILTLNGNSITVAGLVASGGTGTITTQNANTTAATLTIGNSTTTSYAGVLQDGTGGGSLSLVEAGSAVQTVTGNVTLTGSITANSGTLAISGAISNTSGVTVNNGGILTLSGANTFTTGITLATGGTLNINSAAALGTGPFSVAGTINNTSAGGAVTVTTTNAMTWSNFTFTGSNALNLGTGTVSLGAGTGTDTVTVSASTLTVGGVISSGASNNSLTKAGAGTLVLTGANTYSGLTTVSTGILNIQNNTALGTGGTIVVTDGAKLQMQGTITVTGVTLTTGFLESVSGSNIWSGNITGPTAIQFTLQSDTGANLVISGNVNGNGHTTILAGGGSGEISGVISNVFNGGTSGFNMNGTGTWILDNANNSYAAPTAVGSGNLQVGKNGVGQTGTMATIVSSGATLSGSGSIIGAATVTGTVSPGDNGGTSAGQLGFKAGLTFNPTTATTSAKLNLTSSASGDNIHVTGALTLNSNSNFVVTLDPGYTLNTGDSWDLMDWTGLLTLGGFSTGTNFRTGANSANNEGNLDLPDLTQLSGYSGQVWQISALADGSTAGSLVITITPEPSRVLLLIFGVFGAMWRRRRN